MYREYLPFASAREFQDRGMAKWMGFFLSEHTSALGERKRILPHSLFDWSSQEGLLLLGQLYASQSNCQLDYVRNKEVYSIKGVVTHLEKDSVMIRDEHYHRILLDEIMEIRLVKEGADG
ncbi:hypothetical protein ACVR1I_04080 [Streptococcus cameli]